MEQALDVTESLPFHIPQKYKDNEKAVKTSISKTKFNTVVPDGLFHSTIVIPYIEGFIPVFFVSTMGVDISRVLEILQHYYKGLPIQTRSRPSESTYARTVITLQSFFNAEIKATYVDVISLKDNKYPNSEFFSIIYMPMVYKNIIELKKAISNRHYYDDFLENNGVLQLINSKYAEIFLHLKTTNLTLYHTNKVTQVMI